MIRTRPFTDAVAAALAAGTGKPIGKGRRPDGKPLDYYILWRIDRQTGGAPFSDLNEDATLIYQITCVSAPDPTKPGSFGSQAQLEWLEDKARDVILGRDPATGLWLHPLTVPGIKVMARRPDIEAGGTPDPADGIMSSASRFAFDLTST
ncbi:hypothetical protein [Streptomyces tendae]|uniref:hypothetical protein n=1 Tax=Streptomyces tendae TaxID=1932 RepID=UPI003D751A08